MSRKKFFKPIRARICLFLALLIFLVVFFVGMFLCTFSFSFENNPLCNSFNQRVVGVFLFFILVLPQLLVHPVLALFAGSRWLAIALSVIVGLAYLYFLACLMLWVCEKLRASQKRAKK